MKVYESSLLRISTHLVAEYAVHAAAAAVAGRVPRETVDAAAGKRAPVLLRRRLTPQAAGLPQERPQRRVARVRAADAVPAVLPGCRGEHRRQRRPETAQAADAADAAAREACRGGSQRIQLCALRSESGLQTLTASTSSP